MIKELQGIKEQIVDLDEFQKIYLLGFLQGQLTGVKGFDDEMP